MKFDINTIKKKIKNFFSTINTFFSENKKAMIIIILAVILIILLSIMLISMLSQNKNEDKAHRRAKKTVKVEKTKTSANLQKIESTSIWLPDEPIKLPPIQFSREQRQIWKPAEVDYWYEAPDEEAMKELRQKNKKIIDDLMEDAP